MAKRKKQNVVYVVEERRSDNGPWRIYEVETSLRAARYSKSFLERFDKASADQFPRRVRPVDVRIVRYGALEVVE